MAALAIAFALVHPLASGCARHHRVDDERPRDAGRDSAPDAPLVLDGFVRDTPLRLDAPPLDVPGTTVDPPFPPSACHRWECDEVECVEVPLDDGSPCGDGDFCTVGDTCAAGVCETGTEPSRAELIGVRFASAVATGSTDVAALDGPSRGQAVLLEPTEAGSLLTLFAHGDAGIESLAHAVIAPAHQVVSTDDDRFLVFDDAGVRVARFVAGELLEGAPQPTESFAFVAFAGHVHSCGVGQLRSYRMVSELGLEPSFERPIDGRCYGMVREEGARAFYVSLEDGAERFGVGSAGETGHDTERVFEGVRRPTVVSGGRGTLVAVERFPERVWRRGGERIPLELPGVTQVRVGYSGRRILLIEQTATEQRVRSLDERTLVSRTLDVGETRIGASAQLFAPGWLYMDRPLQPMVELTDDATVLHDFEVIGGAHPPQVGTSSHDHTHLFLSLRPWGVQTFSVLEDLLEVHDPIARMAPAAHLVLRDGTHAMRAPEPVCCRDLTTTVLPRVGERETVRLAGPADPARGSALAYTDDGVFAAHYQDGERFVPAFYPVDADSRGRVEPMLLPAVAGEGYREAHLDVDRATGRVVHMHERRGPLRVFDTRGGFAQAAESDADWRAPHSRYEVVRVQGDDVFTQEHEHELHWLRVEGERVTTFRRHRSRAPFGRLLAVAGDVVVTTTEAGRGHTLRFFDVGPLRDGGSWVAVGTVTLPLHAHEARQPGGPGTPWIVNGRHLLAAVRPPCTER